MPSAKPTMPAGVREYFIKGDRHDASAYRPCSTAPRAFTTPTRGAAWTSCGVCRPLVPFSEGAIPIDWQSADDSVEPPDSLIEPKAIPAATYATLPRPPSIPSTMSTGAGTSRTGSFSRSR